MQTYLSAAAVNVYKSTAASRCRVPTTYLLRVVYWTLRGTAENVLVILWRKPKSYYRFIRVRWTDMLLLILFFSTCRYILYMYHGYSVVDARSHYGLIILYTTAGRVSCVLLRVIENSRYTDFIVLIWTEKNRCCTSLSVLENLK